MTTNVLTLPADTNTAKAFYERIEEPRSMTGHNLIWWTRGSVFIPGPTIRDRAYSACASVDFRKNPSVDPRTYAAP